MLVCDTSGLVAYFDASDTHHAATRDTVDGDDGPFIVSPFVLAELDYLLLTRRGVEAELAVLAELSGGAWTLPSIGRGEVEQAARLIERYRDQAIGLADASVVLLAERYDTDRLLTLDHRHFGVLRTQDGRAFTLVPHR